MSELPRLRLWVLGDGACGDVLAEIARWLDYAEVHRGDEAPATLDESDHVVVVATHRTRARALLAKLVAAGSPGYLGIDAPERDALLTLRKLAEDGLGPERLRRIAAPAGLSVAAATDGERAIAIAAELVAVRRQVRAGN